MFLICKNDSERIFLKRHNPQEPKKQKKKKQERRQHRWSFESWKPNGEVGNLLSRSDKAEPYNNSEKKTIFTAHPQKGLRN